MKIDDFEERFEELEDDLKGQCKLIIGSARDWKNKGDEILQTLNTERIQLSQLLSNNQKLNNEILEEIKSNKNELLKLKKSVKEELNFNIENNNNVLFTIQLYISIFSIIQILFFLLIIWLLNEIEMMNVVSYVISGYFVLSATFCAFVWWKKERKKDYLSLH